jgi:hypothetical protein
MGTVKHVRCKCSRPSEPLDLHTHYAGTNILNDINVLCTIMADSKSSAREGVPVQVRPRAPIFLLRSFSRPRASHIDSTLVAERSEGRKRTVRMTCFHA